MIVASDLQIFDPLASIAQRIAEHKELLGERLNHIRAMSIEAAAGNATIADLVEMDQKVAFFCNDLRECCEREEKVVFPALTRLHAQASLSRCQGGAVKARLKFMRAEQEAAANALAAITDLAHRHLSPGGPCESCHDLLIALESLSAALHAHLGKEQDELFAWALAHEEALMQRDD
jgi:iron-sulfur cluster repair protein YtfE (RIC family)